MKFAVREFSIQRLYLNPEKYATYTSNPTFINTCFKFDSHLSHEDDLHSYSEKFVFDFSQGCNYIQIKSAFRMHEITRENSFKKILQFELEIPVLYFVSKMIEVHAQ